MGRELLLEVVKQALTAGCIEPIHIDTEDRDSAIARNGKRRLRRVERSGDGLSLRSVYSVEVTEHSGYVGSSRVGCMRSDDRRHEMGRKALWEIPHEVWKSNYDVDTQCGHYKEPDRMCLVGHTLGVWKSYIDGHVA